jgi:hypothetical protein
MRADLKVPQEDGSVLDIQRDIVDHLAGPISGSLTLSKPYDADHCRMLLTMAHKSRDAIAKLFGMIPPGILVPTEMLGQTVYEFPMVQGLAFGYTDRVIVPAATKKALEDYIRSEGKADRGLAAEPAFKRVARQVPARSSAMFYVDSVKLGDAQMALAKAPDLDPEMPPMGRPLGDMIRWFIAVTAQGQTPESLEAMRKYQSQMIMTLATEDDGLRLDAVVVAPAKLKNAN